ncbi:Putative salt-induced outer membrane protein YdiY [Methylobacillus rhizosphaerae]|uniref:Putative salt-induced outer membrane protein YdiY n=1 Tax=Methylobacillus rhizosphaerae TaxID=551994 RepID=A0A238ZWP7_9PROT|nr:DUF481 domain-containing protein [Methylobacillus rhizosphaerae]SNR87679.1 Putative salt-induced outer membrane protein YdiY [Methylobacillus rhizosphaerae]
MLSRIVGIKWVVVSAWMVSLGLLSLSAEADEVRLKNGDVITGKVLRKLDEKVVFKTSYAGDIQITWSEIETIKTDEPLAVTLTDRTNIKTPIESNEAGKATIQLAQQEQQENSEAQTKEIPLSDLMYINATPELSGVGVNWSGRINLGGSITQGNTDTTTLRLDGESIARTLNHRLTVAAVVNRATSDGYNTQFNNRSSIKLDRFISKKWYVYANNTLENDKFRDIKLRTMTGVGSGYQVYERPDLNLFIEGGLNYVTVNYYDAENESYPGARWAVKYDQRILGGNTQFFHEHEVLLGLDSASNALAFTKTGLRFPIIENFNASIQYNLDWAGQPAEGRKSVDSALIFGLGYSWQ